MLKKLLPRFLTRTKVEKELKRLLGELIEKGPQDVVKYKNQGLCIYIYSSANKKGNLNYNCRELFKKLYLSWPKYSGYHLFPICDKLETIVNEKTCSVGPVLPRDQYLRLPFIKHENFLWTGRQLELRMDLAKWVYNQL